MYVRPKLSEFIKKLAEEFDFGIWSSASEEYVDSIVSQIIPESVPLQFIWGREKCTVRRNYELDEYVRVKKLKKLKRFGYSLDEIIIVDDSPEKLVQNYGNALIVNPFEGNTADNELELLISYLFHIRGDENIRSINKRNWQQKIFPIISI